MINHPSDADVVFWLMVAMLVLLLGGAAVTVARAAPLEGGDVVGFPTWFNGLSFALVCAAIAIGIYDRFIAARRPREGDQ